ncbi:MAG: ester cyclase [Pseudomonadota bacterium]
MVHEENKRLIAALRAALGSADPARIRRALADHFAPDAAIRLGHPFGEMRGPDALWSKVYGPLLNALPDLERRDFILMAGPRWGKGQSGDWVGLGGNIVGLFTTPWLGIPASRSPVFLRYHEYLRIEDGQIVEMEGLWDLPQLMLQADVWPMAPQMGVEWMCPGPASGDGINRLPFDPDKADASVDRVWTMLHDLQQGTAETPERGLGGFWHEQAVWYGPTGLGTARGHAGIAGLIFKQFRDGLSENMRHLESGVFFGDHDYVAFTGWPSGTALHSGDGFLGLAPTGRRITRRSLDFWRLEDGLIRECWVMVDMLDLYRQLGVDVFARIQARSEAGPNRTPELSAEGV